MARPTRKYGARRPSGGAVPEGEAAGREAAYLIDSHNYIFRAFHGLPAFSNSAGRPTNATYGFARTILMLVRERNPAFAAAIFEGPPTRRSAVYAEYKQNRAEVPSALAPQFPDCRRAAVALGLTCLESEGYEADDLMGTIACTLRDAGRPVVLVSGDKDLAQLVGNGITLYDVARDEDFDRAKVIERFGVLPEQIPDLLALTGDSIDNIPGIPGIGAKTAVALIHGLGSLDAILAAPERIASLPLRQARAVAERVRAAGDQPRLARELATIACDAPLDDFDITAIAYRGARRELVEALSAELEFGPRLKGEVPRWEDDGDGDPRAGEPAPSNTTRRANPRRQAAPTGELELDWGPRDEEAEQRS